MPSERDPRGGSARRPPPQTPDEAMARAREHAGTAVAETLRALESLLDAAALATGGAPAAGHPVFGHVARVIDGLAAELSPGSQAGSASLLAAVAEALDLEIARWEKRACEDPDARGVLRAFLGLRELLWEFGVRPEPPGTPPRPAPGAAPEPGSSPRRRRKPGGPRVQRVPVEG